MSFAIDSIGTALPTTVMNQDEALGIARYLCSRTEEQESWLPAMYSHTGIRKRHLSHPRGLVDDILNETKTSGSPFLPTGESDDPGPTTEVRMEIYAEKAGALAVRAAQSAMADSVFTATEITHLITVTCTGFYAPGTDLALVQELGLRPTVERSQIGYMGCHGALNGLRVARAFTEADPSARVMLCAVELCSLHFQYNWDPQRIVANAIFGDGAAVVVGGSNDAVASPTWKVAATGSCFLPDSADAMTWTISDHGFRMTLSKSVPKLIAQHLRPWLEAWLTEHDCTVEQVASWAIHPGGPRILMAAEEAMGLPQDATAVSRDIFSRHGNMSSPTVLFIIDQLRSAQAALPCVALGFGPGLVAEAVLFR